MRNPEAVALEVLDVFLKEVQTAGPKVFLDAFNDPGSDVPIIQTMHEQAAVHIADAHYRVTGQPIAACTSIGPGAANAVKGLANAHCDSTALLLITGSPSTHMRGHGVMQEMDRENTPDFVNVTRPVTSAISTSFAPTTCSSSCIAPGTR